MDAYYTAALLLPGPLGEGLCRVAPADAAAVTEIRLRTGRPVALTAPAGVRYLRPDGRLTEHPGAGCVRTDAAQMEAAFAAVCGHSVHTAQHQVDQGFVAMPGGHRAGVCGTAFWRQDGTMGVGQITSVNIRIARFVCTPLPPAVCALLAKPRPGLLVAGEPGSGKTTVLRNAARWLSEAGRRVAVVDERCELAPSGAPWPDNWDVLSGYPKAVGMMHALRGLGPDVIVCDEIGAQEDILAVRCAANGGTGLLASLHAESPAALRRRPAYRQLTVTEAFSHVVFLAGHGAPGTVQEVFACGADA